MTAKTEANLFMAAVWCFFGLAVGGFFRMFGGRPDVALFSYFVIGGVLSWIIYATKALVDSN